MTILGSIAIAAAAGLGSSFLTIPVQSRLANSKALKTLQEVYGSMIISMENRIKKLESDVEKLTPKRCDKIKCPNRIPPTD